MIPCAVSEKRNTYFILKGFHGHIMIGLQTVLYQRPESLRVLHSIIEPHSPGKRSPIFFPKICWRLLSHFRGHGLECANYHWNQGCLQFPHLICTSLFSHLYFSFFSCSFLFLYLLLLFADHHNGQLARDQQFVSLALEGPRDHNYVILCHLWRLRLCDFQSIFSTGDLSRMAGPGLYC